MVRHPERRPTITHETGAPARTTRPDPIPALTGLRIIGAGWVVLYHFQPLLYEAAPWLRFFEPILGRGEFGVPLFFLLSGFIIWHNYGFRSLLTPRSSVRFLWRRFARLWPVNVVTTLLAVPLIYWSVATQGYWGAPIPDWFSKPGLLKSLFMVSQIGQPDPVFAWNQPSWTLTGEMVAYVAFPLLLALLLVTRATRLRVPLLWFGAGLVIAYFIMDKTFLFPSRWMVELILIFVVGVLIRIAGLPRGNAYLLASVAQIATPIAIIVASYTNHNELMVVLLAIWVWSLSSDRGPGVWLFSTRAAQVAGLSSYSVYMLHWVIFGYGYIFLHYNPEIRASFAVPYTIAALVVVGVASWVMWKFFETPARKLLNRVFELVWPRRPGATAPAEGGVDVSESEIVGVEDVHHEHKDIEPNSSQSN